MMFWYAVRLDEVILLAGSKHPLRPRGKLKRSLGNYFIKFIDFGDALNKHCVP